MKFPTDRPVKVVMLGAGGTGGYVAPYVFRLLHMLDRPARFVVCDGDIVEPKNLDRQNFVPADLGENKARVLAERYSTVLGMETEYVPSFIEKLPDLMELIEPKEWELNPYSTKRTKEMVLLLGCVDNNKTRQLCHQAFHQSEELIYIDSGNGKYTGQVVCGVRRNGRTIRKSIGGVHPEMLKDTDLFPSEISCAEAAQEDPQSILLLLRMIKFLHMQSPDAAHIFCQSHPVVDMEELLMVIDEVMWDIFDDVNFFFDEEYEATVVQCSHPIIDRLYEQGRASDPKHGSRQSVWSKKLHDITEYFVLGATNSVYKFSQHIAGDHVILEFYLSPDYYEPLYFANSLVDLLRYCQCSIRRIEAKLAERETENIRKEAA